MNKNFSIACRTYTQKFKTLRDACGNVVEAKKLAMRIASNREGYSHDEHIQLLNQRAQKYLNSKSWVEFIESKGLEPEIAAQHMALLNNEKLYLLDGVNPTTYPEWNTPLWGPEAKASESEKTQPED